MKTHKTCFVGRQCGYCASNRTFSALYREPAPDLANRRNESERWDWGLFTEIGWRNGDKPFENWTPEEIAAYYRRNEDVECDDV